MTPDMKRLCEAAEAVISEFGEDLSPGSLAREVVRAVLLALREPSEGLKDAMDTPFPTQALNEMADYILAEPAKT